MNRLEQLLMKAIEMRSTELWVAPGQATRLRIGRDWKDISGESAWTPNETKTLLTASLGELDKREFFEKGHWRGQMRLLGRPFDMNLRISEQGLAGSFRWSNSEALDWESWNLPAHMFEVIARSRGATMITGPGLSGKSSLLRLLAHKLCGEGSERLVHIYSDSTGSDLPQRASSFPLKSLASAEDGPADVLLIDSPPVGAWSTILDLSESGRHVVFTTTAMDLAAGLDRWRVFHDRSGRRGLDSLQMGIGTRLIPGLESHMVPAVELLLVTQSLRAPLREGHWAVIEEEMKNSGEKTGMRTLNQSLLQLLLRRKIEMRSAFQESQNPDEFDLLLKKVGI